MSSEAAPVAATESSQKVGDEGLLVSDSQRGTDTQFPVVLETTEKQLEGKAKNENENLGHSNSSDEDEIKYPGKFTKVAVGFSVSLAIFLVNAPLFSFVRNTDIMRSVWIKR
jgi:hypothetical protein